MLSTRGNGGQKCPKICNVVYGWLLIWLSLLRTCFDVQVLNASKKFTHYYYLASVELLVDFPISYLTPPSTRKVSWKLKNLQKLCINFIMQSSTQNHLQNVNISVVEKHLFLLFLKVSPHNFVSFVENCFFLFFEI